MIARAQLEDKIAKIIKDAYAGTGFEDEGRSTEAAHDIMAHISHDIVSRWEEDEPLKPLI